MEIGGVNLMIAFLAGLVSCLSPCVLPLAPIYAGNLAGGAAAVGVVNRRAPMLYGLSFMIGFVSLFVVLGASVGLVGYVLRDLVPLLQKAGGVLLILLGLHMSRIVELSFLYRGFGLDWETRVRAGYVRSFLSGMSISAGWLPCIGPTLGAILTLSLTLGGAWGGGVLLLAYSLGLAVPFVAIGATLSRTPRLLRWMNEHHSAITFVSGLVMIIMGILLFTGTLTRLNAFFQFSNTGLATRI